MSTEVNLEKLYDESVKILTDLIGFRTISGENNSALIDYCENYLHLMWQLHLQSANLEYFPDRKSVV